MTDRIAARRIEAEDLLAELDFGRISSASLREDPPDDRYVRVDHDRDDHEHDAPEQRAAGRGDAVEADADQGAAFDLTDLANAHRLRRHFEQRLRFVPGLGWLVWKDTRWRASGTQAIGLASELGRLIHGEVADAERAASDEHDDQKRERLAHRAKQLLGWAKTSENVNRIVAAMKLAEPMLETAASDLDRDPWLFNLANGTLDLRTRALRPHDPRDLITKISPIRFDPDARSSTWDRALERALPDPETRRFLQKMAGYALTGTTGEDVLILFYGLTRTQKGTIQGAISMALGEYAYTAGLADFAVKGQAGAPRPEIVAMRGARLVSVYESSQQLRLDAALIKTVTGGDPVTARALYQAPICFTPTFKLVIATNKRPTLPDDDDAIWERVREIPFDEQIPREERDPKIRAELRDPERSGPAILAWALEGCRMWQEEGLAPPDIVMDATAEYRSDMDPLREFLADCCVIRPGVYVHGASLIDEYRRWAAQANQQPITGKRWGDALRAHGFEKGRNRKGVVWAGIGLRSDDEVTP